MGGLFSFNGRLRRRDWWLWSIGLGLVNFAVTQVVAPMVLGDDGRPQITPGSFMPTYSPTYMLVLLGMALVLLWPSLALGVRRAHDRDQSGQLFIILCLIGVVCGWAPMIMTTFMHVPPFSGFTPLLGLGGLVIGIYLLVTLGFLDGTPGPNKYGPSPKDAQPPSTPHADYS